MIAYKKKILCFPQNFVKIYTPIRRTSYDLKDMPAIWKKTN